MIATTVDVGNSTIGVGHWNGDGVRVESFTDPREAAATLRGDVAIASVCAARLDELLGGGSGWTPRLLEGTPCRVRDPRLASSAGADRLAAVAALLPGPGLVVDAGTALTVDVLDADGVYLGGFIAPGPELLADALARGTAGLPRVAAVPCRVEPGVETIAAIEAGLWGLAVGGADRLVEAARSLLPASPQPRLVATGGWGEAWCEASRHPGFVFDEVLVHRGIRRWFGLT